MVFTEHRGTLRSLQERITTLLGRQTSVVVVHGSVSREERLVAQFRHDPQAQVLLATDAARRRPQPEPPGTALRPHSIASARPVDLVADETREGDVLPATAQEAGTGPAGARRLGLRCWRARLDTTVD